MPKGKVLDSYVEALIVGEYLRDRKAPRKVLRQKVLNRLAELPEYKGYDPEWPSLNTVHKVVQDAKERETNAVPIILDRPWSLSAQSFFPIEADALPMVVHFWGLSLTERRPLTIREARWLAWLRHLPFGGKDDPGARLETAQDFAEWERINETTQRPYPNSIQEGWRQFFSTMDVYDRVWSNPRAFAAYSLERSGQSNDAREAYETEIAEANSQAFEQFAKCLPADKRNLFEGLWNEGSLKLPLTYYEKGTWEDFPERVKKHRERLRSWKPSTGSSYIHVEEGEG